MTNSPTPISLSNIFV